jgi:hypothetical protein
LPYDDYNGTSLVTPQLLKVLTYHTGVSTNEIRYLDKFPYVQMPWSGTDANACGCGVGTEAKPDDNSDKLLQPCGIKSYKE